MEQNEVQSSELTALIGRLKRRDYGLYLSWRLCPASSRNDLTWLYGFYMDVTRIPYKVDEPMLGEIRLHWWRDQLARARRGEGIGHPVADGLSGALEAGGDELLSVLHGIIESLLFEVQRATIKDQAELYEIFDKRHGGLLRAALIICGLKPEDFEPRCKEAGIAIGLTELICQLPRILERGIMPLPQDLLEKHKLGHEEFTKAELKETQGRVLRELVEGAYGEKAILISWDIKKRLNGVKGPGRAVFSRWYLVPALFGNAMRDRQAGRMVISSVNPLKTFFTMWRASF